MVRRGLQHGRYSSLGAFQTAVDELVQILGVSQGAVDLQALFFRLTLDTTTSFLFGQSLHSLTAVKGSEERNFVDNFDIAQKRAANRMRLPNFPWFLDSTDQRQACKEMEAYIDRLLDQEFGKEDSGRDCPQRFRFLDTIAQDIPERAALRGQVLHFLAAGRDTTASLLSWTLYVPNRMLHICTYPC
jgi:cytochrome P450